MVQGNVVENIGMIIHQLKVTLLRCHKKKTFRPAHGDIKSHLGYQPAKAFPLVTLFVQLLQGSVLFSNTFGTLTLVQGDPDLGQMRHGKAAVPQPIVDLDDGVCCGKVGPSDADQDLHVF